MQVQYDREVIGEWRAFFHRLESIKRIRTEDTKVRYFSRVREFPRLSFGSCGPKNLNLVAYPFRSVLRPIFGKPEAN